MANEVLVTVHGPDVAEQVASLFDWLNDEPALRGWVTVVEPARQAGDMGAVSDTVMILLGPVGAGGLVAVLKTWLQHRSVDVTVTVQPNGGERSVHVSASRAKDAERLLRDLLDDTDGH